MKHALLALTAGLLCAGGTALHALAETPPVQVARNIVIRHDLTGVAGKEVLVGTAEFPPGASIGYHTHPGDESGYVVKGSLTLKTRGQPDRQLEAGSAFFNERGAVHSVVAGPQGATVVSNWIVEKGQPMATAVP